MVGGGKGDERFCNQITSANVRSDARTTIPRYIGMVINVCSILCREWQLRHLANEVTYTKR